MMTVSQKGLHAIRYNKKRTKLSLVLRKIAPQVEIDDLDPNAISRLSKFAYDLTRLEKKQISPEDRFFKILEENNVANPEGEAKVWANRRVIMNALTDEDIENSKFICFFGLPVQFLFASNYLKETYEKNKEPQFFYQVIDEGTYYPGDELLYYLIKLLDEKDVNDLMSCFLNLLDDNAKNYHVALAARIWKRYSHSNEVWWIHLDEKIKNLSVMPNKERKEKMIDPTSLPVLMKILDFLFGEGSKILEERRERRKIQDSASIDIEIPDKTQENNNVITTKDVALSEKIDRAMWLSVERNVQNKFTLLEAYSKNYYLAKEKYAKWTSALVPPIVLHELEESEDCLINTINELQEILAKVYGKKFELPYL